jgi:hypothetical protein
VALSNVDVVIKGGVPYRNSVRVDLKLGNQANGNCRQF